MQAEPSRSETAWKGYLSTLAKASAKKYQDWVNGINEWIANNPTLPLEQNISDYFESCHDHGYSTASLWSAASIFKTYFKCKHSQMNWDSEMMLLTRKLKNWEKAETIKQSKVFTKDQLDEFLRSAPSDDKYLPMKAAAIVSTFGLLCGQELVDFKFDDLKVQGEIRVAKVMRVKGSGPKQESSFMIEGDLYINILDDYFGRFDSDQIQKCEGRLLRKLTAKGNGTVRVIGKVTIAEIPKKIAEFLKLPDAEKYTGHAFRRTGATLLANSGATLLTLKQAGAWKSDSVAQRYIAESDVPKREVAARIAAPEASRSSSATNVQNQPLAAAASSSEPSGITFNISMNNCSNFNFCLPSSSTWNPPQLPKKKDQEAEIDSESEKD